MDISTMYTKKCNKTCGRKGFYRFKEEKETNISPRHYGEFLFGQKRGNKWK